MFLLRAETIFLVCLTARSTTTVRQNFRLTEKTLEVIVLLIGVLAVVTITLTLPGSEATGYKLGLLYPKRQNHRYFFFYCFVPRVGVQEPSPLVDLLSQLTLTNASCSPRGFTNKQTSAHGCALNVVTALISPRAVRTRETFLCPQISYRSILSRIGQIIDPQLLIRSFRAGIDSSDLCDLRYSSYNVAEWERQNSLV